MRITLVLLAAISATWVWIGDIARNPYRMGTSSPVKCTTYDLGKWGSSRTHIKRVQCGTRGVTFVGKWRQQHARRS